MPRSGRPGPRPVDLERAGPEVVAERLERRLGPTRRAGASVADRRAERSRGRRGRSAPSPRPVVDRALDGIAAAVDLRRHLLDLDAWRRGLRDGHVRSLTDEEGSKRGAPSLGRHPAPSDLAPVGQARPARRTGSSTGSPRQASRGGRSCRSARPTSSARRTGRRRPSRLGPSSSRDPTRGSRPARWRTSSRGIRSGRATGRASQVAARSPTRFASSGSGGRCAHYAAERGVRLIGDLPIYVRRRGRRPRRWPELFARR